MLADYCARDNPLTRQLHYLLCGSFKSKALFLLAFDSSSSHFDCSTTIPAQGPHQFLALNAQRSKAYATTWALPPSLSSWNISFTDDESSKPEISFINAAPITATSSYISIDAQLATSAGGPTGEVHQLETDGSLGHKMQQLLFVPEDQLANEDKTRVALRYGSHAVEYTNQGKCFIPHLGHNSIWMYQRQSDGTVELLDEVQSPRPHDGPRHVLPSADGRFLYSVTEHTQFLDTFEIQERTLHYISSQSLLSDAADPSLYRGDTLRLSFSGKHLFTTTRGGTSSTKGLFVVFPVRPEGDLGPAVVRQETPTSGGKANAIEPAPWVEQDGSQWVVLTDDEVGLVIMLRWDEATEQVTEVARVQLPGDELASASHAVWLT